MQYTTSTFAQAIKAEKEDAYNLLRFLVARGLAHNCGSSKTPSKKGRGETLYIVLPEASAALVEMLKGVVCTP